MTHSSNPSVQERGDVFIARDKMTSLGSEYNRALYWIFADTAGAGLGNQHKPVAGNDVDPASRTID